MLDIRLLRESPDVVRADLEKRGRDAAVVDEVRTSDDAWRKAHERLAALNREKNGYDRQMALVSKLLSLQRDVNNRLELLDDQIEASSGDSNLGFRRRRGDEPSGDVKGLELAREEYELKTAPKIATEVRKALGEVRGLGSDLGVVLPSKFADLFSRYEDESTILLESLEALRERWESRLKELGGADSYDLAKGAWASLESLEKGQGELRKGLHSSLWGLNVLLALWQERIKEALRDHKQERREATANEQELLAQRDAALRSLPNLMHADVPVGEGDEGNVELRRWPEGEPPALPFAGRSHVDLLASLDVADLERAARAAGSRFVYLKNDLVLLGRALEFFALDRLAAKGFTPVEPPYMLRREAVEGAVDLADFEDVIYRVEAGKAVDEAKDDAPELFLIATSEHALAAMHMGEIVDSQDLPLRYAGVSPCFRKEAGAHGKDTKGIFRVHQFSKVEQFVYAAPEASWPLHEELIANAEALYQELGIPYRVVDICTGDLGTVAARKYDLEAWFPVQGAYREVVSCSNCTDYQARRYNTRHRKNPGDPTAFVHTLNATAIAVQRTLVAILENFQQEDGSVAIPEVLRPYVGHRTHMRSAGQG